MVHPAQLLQMITFLPVSLPMQGLKVAKIAGASPRVGNSVIDFPAMFGGFAILTETHQISIAVKADVNAVRARYLFGLEPNPEQCMFVILCTRCCSVQFAYPFLLRNILTPPLESVLIRSRVFWLVGGGEPHYAVCFALLVGRIQFRHRLVRW